MILLCIGAAYSRNIVQLYSYHGSSNSVRKQLEVGFFPPLFKHHDGSALFQVLNIVFQIEAHAGSVNDLAFSKPYNQLLVITCGDDKLIQVNLLFLNVCTYQIENYIVEFLRSKFQI